VPTVYLHEQDGFPFDGSLRDIASTYDTSTARWVAKSLQYPTQELGQGPAWPWMPTVRPTLLAAVGVGAVLLSRRLWTVTRRRRAPHNPTVLTATVDGVDGVDGVASGTSGS
jgi:hypothetical protein